MSYTDYGMSTPNFIVDYHSLDRLHGRQIDWDNVPDAAPWQGTDQRGRTFKMIRAGTVLSYQAATGMCLPRQVAPGDNGAEFVLMSEADEITDTDAITGFGVIVGGVLLETVMPDTFTNQDFATANPDWDTYKTELNNTGNGFRWETYTNNAGA